MTDHQIAYNRLLEERRANKAKEIETNRANLAKESLQQQEIDESNRAARMREFENMRHNQVTESEDARHNQAQEMKDVYGIDVNRALGYGNINLGYANLSESTRSNLRNEQIKEWSSSAQNAINRAKTLTDMQRVEIESAKQELAAREFDLSQEKFELERDIRQREMTLREDMSDISVAESLLKLVLGGSPASSMKSVFGF